MANPDKRAWFWTWIFAVLPLLGWWFYGLFDLDEGFYGAVVSEMNRRGEWITPFYNGHPWFEKPILLYWLAKPFMLIFGDVLGPRMPSVLATLATYWLVAWFARRRWDGAVARWCVLVLASSLFVVALGRMMMTDSVLAFCLAGAMIFFWEAREGSPRWLLLCGLCLGLSVLAKGPVGLILFLPIAVATSFWARSERRLPQLWWALSFLVMAATIATWYLPAHLVNGDMFVQKFLIEQNLNRFTGGDAAHTMPGVTGYLMYIAVLLLGMAPWSFYAVGAVKARLQEPIGRFLFVWAAVPFLFFEVGKAKLPHYVLPCAVPLALILGSYLAARMKSIRPAMIACAVVAILANAGFMFYYNMFHREVHELARYVRSHARPGEEVDVYQMPRREKTLGTGKIKIQETSHPSLVMYLNRPLLEPERLEQILSNPAPQWILTRWNRIRPEDFGRAQKAGRPLVEAKTPVKQDLYRLFYLPGAK